MKDGRESSRYLRERRTKWKTKQEGKIRKNLEKMRKK